ncbi:hypothetical protein DL93DRAFT_2072771, partial [Clavulina sp. PMI_390]
MLAAASMWTNVSILEQLDLKKDSVWRKTHDRIQAFLERSNFASLSLTIERQKERGFDRLLKLWDLIIPHLHRCSHITIKLDNCPTAWFWDSIKSADVPRLTTFSFVDGRNNDTLGCEADMKLEDISWHSVPLKKFSFEGTNRFILPPIICPTIDSLRFTCPSSVGWMAGQVLARYPSIRELGLTFTQDNGSDDTTSPSSIPVIDLPSLSEMTLANPHPLIAVNTPSLSHLTLSLLQPHTWLHLRETKSATFPFPMGWRAPLSLTSFTLDDCGFCLHDIGTVATAFESIPDITTFKIERCDGQVFLFALLDAALDSSPGGQNVAYREPPRIPEAIPAVIEMERGCFPRLEVVIVANCEAPRPALYEELRLQRPQLELQFEGMPNLNRGLHTRVSKVAKALVDYF